MRARSGVGSGVWRAWVGPSCPWSWPRPARSFRRARNISPAGRIGRAGGLQAATRGPAKGPCAATATRAAGEPAPRTWITDPAPLMGSAVGFLPSSTVNTMAPCAYACGAAAAQGGAHGDGVCVWWLRTPRPTARVDRWSPVPRRAIILPQHERLLRRNDGVALSGKYRGLAFHATARRGQTHSSDDACELSTAWSVVGSPGRMVGGAAAYGDNSLMIPCCNAGLLGEIFAATGVLGQFELSATHL